MHEHSFISAIINDIRDKDNITGILIELGDLVGITAKHLREHLTEMTGWNVEIQSKLSKIKCDCGYKGNPEIKQRLHDLVVFSCPKCQAINPDVLEGKDIKILKIIYNH
ncbi:MAG TPA: hypothetical protein ENG87_02060 [Candidatus Pacearchaeota archaeon]|nr:hydrogenase nickel incorporation protein [archaeon BMS3Abin17]HDK42138.1 hypothetical protein [Candidatus Pacearchaeota archaeon]HDZ61317.1 hypothetical protein [Candidatus Pacearchaeota archaeon]